MIKTHRIALVLLALGLMSTGLYACGQGSSNHGIGQDGVPTIIEDAAAMNTFRVAALGADELQIIGSGASHDTLIQAHFNDFSNYQVQLADRVDFEDYPACVVYTSMPVTSGEPVPLLVTRATFSGLAGGDLVLEPNEFDRLPTELMPQRGFAAEQVQIVVESDGGADGFPAFSETIGAPEQPVVTRLGAHKNVDLATGPSLDITTTRMDNLLVTWQASDSDYVEIKLNPGSGTATPFAKLRCVTFDDGGLEIPAAAISYLAMDAATNFKFRIEHHKFILHSIEADGQVDGAALIDNSSTVEAVVLR